MDAEPIRVLIADDHPVYRDGLRVLLGATPDFALAGEAADGGEAVTLTAECQPDVVLMDLKMPRLDGIEATRQIVAVSPHVGIVILTMLEDDESVFAALRAGARGYVLKGAGREELQLAIRAVARGEALYGSAIARRLMAYFAPAAPLPSPPSVPSAFPELTGREREVLALVAAGQSNAAIAERLFLSLKTVRNHVSNILGKLQVADRAQAIVRAREAGLGRDGA